LFCLVHEGLEADDVPITGRELAFGQTHDPEPDVLQFHLDPDPTGHGEKLVKMELLPLIRDIEDLGRLPALDAIQHRGDVRGRIVESPIALLDDKWRQAFFFEEHHQGAIAPACDPFPFQVVDECLEAVVVEALAKGNIKGNPEPFVDSVELMQGRLHELLPELAILRVPVLQADEFTPRFLHERRILLGLLVALHVDPLQFFDRILLKRLGISEPSISDEQDTELRPPIPHMVVRNDVKAEKPVYPVQGKAKDRGSDVTDVHGFGHVWAREVDHDGLPLSGPFHPDPLVLKGLLYAVGQPGAGKPEIHETGSGHLHFFQPRHSLQPGGQFLGNLPRRPSQLLRQPHGPVELVVAELGIRRRNHPETLRIRNRFAQLIRKRLRDGPGTKVNDRCHRFLYTTVVQ